MNYKTLAESPKFLDFYKLLCKMSGLTLVLCDEKARERIYLDYRQDMGVLCRYMRNNPAFTKRCTESDKLNCHEAVRERTGRFYRCHAGLQDVAVPIFINGKLTGLFMGGQMLPEEPDEKNFRIFLSNLKQYGFNESELKTYYMQSPWMQPDRMQAAFQLISLFAEHFCELGSRIAEKESGNSRLEKVKRLIQSKRSEALTMRQIAGEAGFTPNYFCHWFKEHSGTGYLEYLTGLRLEKAANLLIETDMEISRAAFESGFTSLSSFNRTFRKHYKCSPSLYRTKR